jgi:amino acid permease
LKVHQSEMNTGGLICIVGIAVTFFTYVSSVNGGSYVIAWGAILFGAIRFFKGASNKEKYKTILANIEAENTPPDNLR